MKLICLQYFVITGVAIYKLILNIYYVLSET